jgi:CBS domain containing-hemolysin-like protein
VRQPDGSFIADARAKLEEVVAVVGAGFDVGEVVKEVDTLGGYLVTQAGRVPVRGELVQGPGSFEIEVLDADPRRVKKVKIHRSKARKADRPREPRSPAKGLDVPSIPGSGTSSSDSDSATTARRP